MLAVGKDVWVGVRDGDGDGLAVSVGGLEGAKEPEGRLVTVGAKVGLLVFVGEREGDGEGLCVSVGTEL